MYEGLMDYMMQFMREWMMEFGPTLFVYLSIMVIIACYKKDTSVANFTWGGGVLIVTLLSLFRGNTYAPAQLLISSLITVWAARLIAYVYMRYDGKDKRFATWKWRGIQTLFINIAWVFGQLIMIVIMSYPVVVVNGWRWDIVPSLSMYDVMGLLVWLFGFYWEAVSDNQLFTFMKNPANKGHVMTSGLWKYSRHPNYFGECVMWWGIFLFALPYGMGAIIAPITITFLLVFVTGIPLLERSMADNGEYQEYKRRTSMIIPWL